MGQQETQAGRCFGAKKKIQNGCKKNPQKTPHNFQKAIDMTRGSKGERAQAGYPCQFHADPRTWPSIK